MITNEIKAEMIRLRYDGWTLKEIGIRFGVDRSTAYYHISSPDRLVQNRRRKGTVDYKKPISDYKPKIKEKKVYIRKAKDKSYKDYIEQSQRVKIIRDNEGEIIRKIEL